MALIDYSFHLRLDVEADSYEDAERKLAEALDAMDDVPASIYVIPEAALSLPRESERQMPDDSYLRCAECGRTSTTGFASSLRTGWEKCCGYTMRLMRTDADIERAVGQIAGPGARFADQTKEDHDG